MRRTFVAILLVVAVATVVVACGSSNNENPPPAPVPTTTASGGGGGSTGGGTTAEGQQIFVDNCAGCHKEDGSGGFGPNIQNEDNLDKVVNQVTNGGSQMPAFQGQLTDAQIQAVSNYVISGL